MFGNRGARWLGAGSVVALLVAGLTSGVLGAAQAAPGPAPSGPPDDAPDARTLARSAGAKPNGAWVTDTIWNRKDSDWYRFDVTSTSYVSVTLGNLPADYSLGLYDDSGTALGASTNAGREFERVIRRVGPGRYYARVSTGGQYSATKKYRLKFVVPKAGVVPLASTITYVGPADDRSDVSGQVEFFNNTTSWQQLSGYVLEFYDAQGNTTNAPVDVERWGAQPIIPPGAVLPHHLAGFRLPDSTTRIAIRPKATAVSEKGDNGLRVSVRRTEFWGQGTEFDHRVILTNTSASHRRDANVRVAAYNAAGAPIWSTDDNLPIDPKQTRAWRVEQPKVYPNRVVPAVWSVVTVAIPDE